MTNNIFLVLSKYNSAIDENYLTEAFVFVLNSLLESERQLCIKILKSLCINNDDYYFSENEPIKIVTQVSTGQGRPDIKIFSPNKLIYIEVKHDSMLGERQIERYKTALGTSDASVRKVILLTRFPVDFEQQEKPYKHVLWREVHNWLLKLKSKNPVNDYFINAFLKFLEVKEMSVQKVSWEYMNGMAAFKNLINMLRVAIESASLTVYQQRGAQEWYGFYINGNKILCAIYYDNPLLLKFEVWGDKGILYSVSLDFEAIYFFALDKDVQLDRITNFIKESYKLAKEQLPQIKL